MQDDAPISAKDFGASFKGFLEQVASQAPAEEPVFLRRLRAHFDAEPTNLPVVEETFEKSEHPNLYMAMEAYLAGAGRSAELMGVIVPEYVGIKLPQLIAPTRSGLVGGPPAATEGPVQYINIGLEDDRVLACVQSGLYLIRDGEERLVVFIHRPHEAWQLRLHVEVMAADRGRAEAFLAKLRANMRKRNVYRGHVVSLVCEEHGEIQVRFHRLPKINRDDIILPQGLLARVERQTLGFSRLSEKLQAAGRHLKRGMLLYGAPGTGKTLTAMYLAGQMPNRTVILLLGRGVGLIEQSCAMARILQPSTVILEDVDLIAEERTHQERTVLLFELLNQMDGLADDADILFLLTTNRPDILEPALAARPGRIDLAIEMPLPDADCRRRLFELYGRGLELRLQSFDRLIEQTEGVSPAFIRELLRKAALFAAEEGSAVLVEDPHVAEALHELVIEGGELTKRLLGAGSAAFPRA